MPANDLAPVEIAEVLTYINNSFGNKMGIITLQQANDDLLKCRKDHSPWTMVHSGWKYIFTMVHWTAHNPLTMVHSGWKYLALPWSIDYRPWSINKNTYLYLRKTFYRFSGLTGGEESPGNTE